MNTGRVFSPLFLLIGLLCSSTTVTFASAQATSTATTSIKEDISFKNDIIPILKRRCAVCHITGEEPGKMALTPAKSYQAIVSVPAQYSDLNRIEPYKPEQSYLLHKIRGSHLGVGGQGERMPYMAPPLSDEQTQLITHWILNGAPNN